MRLPVSWLREFVRLPDDVTAEQLLADFVRVGFEEEDVHTFGVSGPVVVGQVLEFTPEPQSNGKTINWCSVDVGPSTGSGQARDIRGIVCGAHNFAVGDKVVVTLPGAVLPGPFPIAARKTYGHVSDGMIASARELGLGDEHSGILLLKDLGLDPVVGSDAAELLGLDDFAVEINVTPDRGYALSLRGSARELSHSTGAAYTDPAQSPELAGYALPDGVTEFPVALDDRAPIRGRAGAFAFTTRVVRDIDPTRPTPPWMVSRLALAGIRSISLVVDITNYVMLEFGQPTHSYDLDKVAGGIVVRRAGQGEKITTLDEQTRALDVEDLLITDDSGPIGIAGVMGGASTEIGAETRNVLVEAGNFDPVSVARSARRHKLPSEASRRFERGVDPLVTEPASRRVVQLLVELAGGTPDAVGSIWIDADLPEVIEFPDGFASRITGVDYTEEEVVGSLELIGATIEATADGLLVTPPSWRPDLTDRWTLVEEIARIVGYDRIPAVLPVAPPGRGLTRSQRLRRSVSSALAAAGSVEVLSYPFLSREQVDRFAQGQPAIRVANPLDGAAPFLRTSLLPGLAEIAHRNLSRGSTDLALFEVGVVFQPVAGATYGSGPLPSSGVHPSPEKIAELDASIPPQPWHLAALALGESVAKQPGVAAVPAGIADALTIVDQVAAALAVDIHVTRGAHPAFHPGRTAELFVGETPVGFAGELLPALSVELDLPRVVGVVELDLSALIEQARLDVQAHPISTLPAATQDLSLLVLAGTAAGEVLATVIEGGGELLEHAALVDDYRGHGVPEGTRSLTFALRFRAADRTLTAAEATAAKNEAVALAATRHGATVRE